jgi:hypothetical protein
MATAQGNRIARAFGLQGEAWMRHSNPASVWTRFAVLPMLAVSIWSRHWIGWWSLIPIGLSLVWLAINPLLFAKPRSTRHWASKAVLGERIWTESDRSRLPTEFRSRATNVALAFQLLGLILLAYVLVVLEALAVISGIVIVQLAKLWYLDRMVLLFEAMKTHTDEYTSWDY